MEVSRTLALGTIVASTIFFGIVTPPPDLGPDAVTTQPNRVRTKEPISIQGPTDEATLRQLHLAEERVKEVSKLFSSSEASTSEERARSALLKEQNQALQRRLEERSNTVDSEWERKVTELEKIKMQMEDVEHDLRAKIARQDATALQNQDDLRDLQTLRKDSEQLRLIKERNEELQIQLQNSKQSESTQLARLDTELREEQRRYAALKRELDRAKATGTGLIAPPLAKNQSFVIPEPLVRLHEVLDRQIRKISPRGLSFGWMVDVMFSATVYTIILMAVLSVYNLVSR
eukprot:TRINITY_DN5997_c0_g1_i1.p1 TRINITY_DN5997_c0_g1~~TRINITY_DN5997_c0_g1_i1.p1  ORF type:complete len:289 (-),score=93.18 TRINITY_DN5997_c0_g1_i1:44-910(-)